MSLCSLIAGNLLIVHCRCPLPVHTPHVLKYLSWPCYESDLVAAASQRDAEASHGHREFGMQVCLRQQSFELLQVQPVVSINIVLPHRVQGDLQPSQVKTRQPDADAPVGVHASGFPNSMPLVS